MSGGTPQEDEFFRQAVWYGNVSCTFLAPISVSVICWLLDSDITSGLFWIAWMFGQLWTRWVVLYLLFHPVTLPLPTWLTSGHPVTFGGITPNVCDNHTLSLGWNGGHDWPCLPSELATRFANVAGPEGWKWLLQLDAKVGYCLIFFVLNLGILTMLMFELRKLRSGIARNAKGTGETNTDIDPSEPGDCEKQQETTYSD